MPKIIQNDKGFKVIEIEYGFMAMATGNNLPVCDSCLKNDCAKGYYIAVLNMWYCKKCYERWLKTAVNYPEDKAVEDRNFNFYKNVLEKLMGDKLNG